MRREWFQVFLQFEDAGMDLGEISELPGLGGEGFWHREGFTGAVLPASRLGLEGQDEQVREYLAASLAASHNLLAAAG